jgi:quercetin dioxygenase-like cupin family protein
MWIILRINKSSLHSDAIGCVIIMINVFPKQIRCLPQVDIAYEGVTGYVSQGENEQVVFMEFQKATDVPEHSHASQWEIVLEGRVDYIEDGVTHTYKKGDRFFVNAGKEHSAKVYAGYACIMFFDQKDRYKKK